MTARKIKMSPVKNVVCFPATKVPDQGWIHVESLLERDCCISFEFDFNVVSYQPQPRTFHYVDRNGVSRRYTPDFLVVRKNHPDPQCFVEVKHSSRLTDTKTCQKLEDAGKHIRGSGFGFELFTEQDLESEARASNLRFFYPYLINAPDDLTEVEAALENVSPLTTGSALSIGDRTSEFRAGFLHLIAISRLTINWNEEFSIYGTECAVNE